MNTPSKNTGRQLFLLLVLPLLFVFLLPAHTPVSAQNPPPTPPKNEGQGPGSSQGQESENDGVILLAPDLPRVGAEVPRGGLGGYLNGMFLLGIGVASGLAVVIITVGGVQYMVGASAGNKEAGREKIMAAIGGLVLALASFLILRTLNPDLLEFKVIQAIQSAVERARETATSTPSAAPIPLGEGQVWPSDESEREKLRNATLGPDGVTAMVQTWSSANRGSIPAVPCQVVGQKGCTSLLEINGSFYSIIKGVVERSGCRNLLISGGTEFWLHNGGQDISDEVRLDEDRNPTTHKRGNATVDILSETCFNNYVMRAVPQTNDTGALPFGHKVEHDDDGYTYRWEKSHWHVNFLKKN